MVAPTDYDPNQSSKFHPNRMINAESIQLTMLQSVVVALHSKSAGSDTVELAPP